MNYVRIKSALLIKPNYTDKLFKSSLFLPPILELYLLLLDIRRDRHTHTHFWESQHYVLVCNIGFADYRCVSFFPAVCQDNTRILHFLHTRYKTDALASRPRRVSFLRHEQFNALSLPFQLAVRWMYMPSICTRNVARI